MENLKNEHAFKDLQEIGANNAVEIVQKNEQTLGMLFDSHEEMFAFYKVYGK